MKGCELELELFFGALAQHSKVTIYCETSHAAVAAETFLGGMRRAALLCALRLLFDFDYFFYRVVSRLLTAHYKLLAS